MELADERTHHCLTYRETRREQLEARSCARVQDPDPGEGGDPRVAFSNSPR